MTYGGVAADVDVFAAGRVADVAGVPGLVLGGVGVVGVGVGDCDGDGVGVGFGSGFGFGCGRSAASARTSARGGLRASAWDRAGVGFGFGSGAGVGFGFGAGVGVGVGWGTGRLKEVVTFCHPDQVPCTPGAVWVSVQSEPSLPEVQYLQPTVGELADGEVLRGGRGGRGRAERPPPGGAGHPRGDVARVDQAGLRVDPPDLELVGRQSARDDRLDRLGQTASSRSTRRTGTTGRRPPSSTSGPRCPCPRHRASAARPSRRRRHP